MSHVMVFFSFPLASGFALLSTFKKSDVFALMREWMYAWQQYSYNMHLWHNDIMANISIELYANILRERKQDFHILNLKTGR